ncbi:[Wnt protein] O-palmitoleoyl-L-serine hydrolase [Sarracenia purpurea var. burkii]
MHLITPQALLSGCSAGGLATLIHCDNFRELLPENATVKCLGDAGFFLNEKDIAGHRTIESFYQDVVHLQGIAKSLDRDCVARMEPSKVDVSDPHGNWLKCLLNIGNCNRSQIEVLEGYRNSLLKILSEFQQNKDGGLFINSCFVHCQTWMTETWHSSNSPRINGKTIAESVGDWYFNRKIAKQIDCPYPCNPTCYNIDFTRGR